MTAALATVEPEDEISEKEIAYEFDEDFQNKIVGMALRDPTFMARIEGLIDPKYLTNVGQAALFDVIERHYAKFRSSPDMPTLGVLLKEAIKAKRIRPDVVDDVKAAVRSAFDADLSGAAFVAEKVSEFARERAVEKALIESVGRLEKRDFASIEKTMREALLIGEAETESGYDYFEAIEGRTDTRKSIAAGTHTFDSVTTGIEDIDKLLYHHGWGRGELSLLMGPAKGGKSLGLGQFAAAAAISPRRHNVLIVTLENAAAIYADRLDANLSDTMMRALKDMPHKVKEEIDRIKTRSGIIKIHEYPTGTMRPSQLRRLIENYKARGLLFDLVVVDYADIMAPERRTDNDIANFRSIYTDLRGIAKEFHVALLTATQTNREGAKKVTSSMTDVAEDFNKIRLADIVISINATQEEKDTGEARLFFAASRNTEDGFTIRVQQDRARMKFIKRVLGRE